MAIDLKQQWRKARTEAAEDEVKSIKTLAKILSLKEGRTFILELSPKDAELCIEMLDQVSSNPRRLCLWSHRCNRSGSGGT